MKEVLITSGTSFEGYEIVDYGTYKFTQTIMLPDLRSKTFL